MRLRAVAALHLILAGAAPALAQEGAAPPQGFITMTGRGVATAIPDVATVRLSVTADAQSFKQAFDAAGRKVSALVEALGTAGVPQSQVRSERFQATPVRAGEGLAAFQVRHTLVARVRGLGRLGDVLERAASAGVTEVSAPEIAGDDSAAALRDARQRAARDADERAKSYAESLGLRLGRVVSVTEGDPRKPPEEARQGSPEGGIDLGQSEVRATVTVVWEIDPTPR